MSMALAAIGANKLRSLLSGLGIFIGVFSIILILTMMEGFKFYINDTFSSLGGNSVYVNKMPLIITSFEQWQRLQKRKDLKLSLVDDIKEESIYATHVAPMFNMGATVQFRNESDRSSIVYSSEELPHIQGLEIEEGRFYTAGEVKSGAKVCVVGTDIIEKYFLGQNPLGHTLKIRGRKYRVIGILKSRGAFFGNSLDNEIHVPITTLHGSLNRRKGIFIGVAAASPKEIEALKDELAGIVRKARKVEPKEKNDFAIFQFNEIASFLETITQTAYLTVIAISMISLLVGGVGIMNIMVVSVTERTREIGIRKSLGAKRSSILGQFLYEAIFLTIFGGIPAIIIGFGIASIGLYMLVDLGFTLTAMPFIVGFGFSVLVGIISGFMPALRASKLKPVEALAQ